MDNHAIMKTHVLKTAHSTAYWTLIATAILSVGALTACEKKSEPESNIEVQVQNSTSATNLAEQQKTAEALKKQQDTGLLAAKTDMNAADSTDDINTDSTRNDSEATNHTADMDANTQALPASPEQAIEGTQITDVRYRSATGEELSVVFETSATGVLNAMVTLPNQPKIILSAPEGQGNNPIYRSTDGSIELISHGGGSTIELHQNEHVLSFEAISAEAEVVTQS